jgi:hypothetical protein
MFDTSSDPEPSVSTLPATPKWPFLLGDFLLVAGALALSVLYAPLRPLQAFIALGAVGVGAVLGALPFVMEFLTHAQLRRLELEQARAEDFQRLGALDAELQRQARAAAETQENLHRAAAALESATRRLDTHLAPLPALHQTLETTTVAWQEAAARQAGRYHDALEAELARLRQNEADKLHAVAAALAALAPRLESLPARLAADTAGSPTQVAIRERLDQLSRLLDICFPAESSLSRTEAVPAETTPTVEAVATAEPVPAAEAPPADEPPAPAETAPVEEPFPMTDPDSLLGKALAAAQSAEDSPAVARIIQSRPRRARKSKADAPAVPAPEPVAEPDHVTAEPAPSFAEATEGKRPDLSSEALPYGGAKEETAVAVAEPPPIAEPAPAEATSPAAALAEAASLETETSKPDPSAKVLLPGRATEESDNSKLSPVVSARAKAAALRAADEEEEPAPAQGELLAAQAEAARSRRTPKAAPDAATLVARVLIGIGNKPYIRGDGPGLSHDRGVPMEFVEIGKWQWVAPADAPGPITVRILKNDEVPASGGPILLAPGETVDVSPVFPA